MTTTETTTETTEAHAQALARLLAQWDAIAARLIRTLGATLDRLEAGGRRVLGIRELATAMATGQQIRMWHDCAMRAVDVDAVLGIDLAPLRYAYAEVAAKAAEEAEAAERERRRARRVLGREIRAQVAQEIVLDSDDAPAQLPSDLHERAERALVQANGRANVRTWTWDPQDDDLTVDALTLARRLGHRVVWRDHGGRVTASSYRGAWSTTVVLVTAYPDGRVTVQADRGSSSCLGSGLDTRTLYVEIDGHRHRWTGDIDALRESVVRRRMAAA